MLRELVLATLMGVTLFCILKNSGELGYDDVRMANRSDVLFIASVWSNRKPSQLQRLYLHDVGELRPEFLIGNWSSEDAYYPTDTVFYQSALWMATEANVNRAPGAPNHTSWRPLLLFGSEARRTLFQKYDMVLDIATTMAVYMCNTERCVSSSEMGSDKAWQKMESQTDVFSIMYGMTQRREQEKAEGDSQEQQETFRGAFLLVAHAMVLAMHNDLRTAVLNGHQQLQTPIRLYG